MPPKRSNVVNVANAVNNIPVISTVDIDPNADLKNILGSNALSVMTPAEERRLKADLKKGVDITKSEILKNIITRCPELGANSNLIAKLPSVTNQSNQVNNKTKRSFDNSENNSYPFRKRAKTNNSKTDIVPTKPDTIIIDLGSQDTDETLDTDEDQYEDDGFIVFDDNNNDSDIFDGFDGSYDSEQSDTFYPDKMDIEEELNDLYDDVINTGNVSKEEAKHIQSSLVNIRSEYLQGKVDIAMIIKANFNKEDAVWFYKNIKRLSCLASIDRFKLEDTIEKKYKFLVSLQAVNMYTSFTRGDDRDIIRTITTSKHSDSVKSILINRMCNLSNESIDEYQKALNWMDTVLSIPTETKSSRGEINKSIKTLHDNLTKNLHGMDTTVKEILQAVCSILSDPNNKGNILALVGPPGVGKTTISSMISESIGMGFGQISCGSINDQATITGHGSTYIGSTPGVFTQYLINNGQLDNVILLDEMDKIYNPKIIPVFLHILDKSQNSKFRDAFCPEIAIDLSKNFYIVAVNSVDGLDKALKDRLKIVNVSGYDVDEKTQICIKHLIPKLNLKTGITLSISVDIIRKCILKISSEVSGVREIERFFGDIYEKLLLIKTMGPTYFGLPKSFNVSKLKTIDIKLISQLCGVTI